MKKTYKVCFVITAILFCMIVVISCEQPTNAEKDIWTEIKSPDELIGVWEGIYKMPIREGSEYAEVLGTYIFEAHIPDTYLLNTQYMEYQGGDTDLIFISKSDYSKFLDDIVKANSGKNKDSLWEIYAALMTGGEVPDMNIKVEKYYLEMQGSVPISSLNNDDLGSIFINQHKDKIKFFSNDDFFEETFGGSMEAILNKKQ